MKIRVALPLAGALLLSVVVVSYLGHERSTPAELEMSDPMTWLSLAGPGDLSNAHSFLDHSCADCHTPVQGIEVANCIQCHSNESAITERQPTAFHANIGSCRECHTEHMGRDFEVSMMDHNAFVRISLRELESDAVSGDPGSDQIALLNRWLDQVPLDISGESLNPKITRLERMLDCTSCHQNDDRHLGLMGDSCASCHETTHWTVPEYRHPAPNSMDCAQCHQAPPSHYMEHFKMISAKVAGQPHAKVDQCFVCHQTTSWNDIKDVGLYKHH